MTVFKVRRNPFVRARIYASCNDGRRWPFFGSVMKFSWGTRTHVHPSAAPAQRGKLPRDGNTRYVRSRRLKDRAGGAARRVKLLNCFPFIFPAGLRRPKLLPVRTGVNKMRELVNLTTRPSAASTFLPPRRLHYTARSPTSD